MNKRLFNFFVGLMFLCSATLPMQGMSFVRRFGGSVAAAARMVTARVASSTPRVAQAPVRSLSKISGRSAMNPVVSQAVRRASTHAKFDVKKLLSRAQEVGVVIGIVGIIGFDAYEKFSKDWRDIFKKGKSAELQRWFREHDCDEKLQKKIINYCMTHWDTLSADKLHVVIDNVPEAAAVFTQSAADNFAKLVGRYNGRNLVHKIMEKNPAAVQAFTQPAADNFVKLVDSPDGGYLVHKIMEKNPAAVQAFTQSAADNITDIVENYTGCKLLHEIMEKNPVAVQIFMQSAADDFAALVKASYGRDLLHKIMKNDSAAVRLFMQLVAGNFAELVKASYGIDLVHKIMENDPATAQVFTPLAVGNIVELIKNEDGRNLLAKIIESNSSAMELFALALEKAGIETDFTLLLQIQNKHARGEQLSPSEAHLLANKHLVLDKLLPQDVQKLQQTILMNEHRLLDAGYVSFYHGQSDEKRFAIELDTFLHGIQSGEQVDEFYLMHTRADQLRKKAWSESLELDVLHEEIMHYYLKAKDGAERERLICESNGGGDDRNRMLFLNGSLRGNATNRGSQSFPGYFMDNKNAGGQYRHSSSIMCDVFKNHGLDSLYEQFKDELRQLHEEYIKLSKYGTLYQIAIPRDKAGQIVRPAVSGGGRSKLSIAGEKTEDMHKIIAASRDPKTHPGDQNEFVAMMTYDENGLMNPKCGAKIKAYMIPTDEAKYQEWCAKWEDLKARIKAEVERTRPADYVAPAHVQELVGLYVDAYARSSKPHLYGSRGWLEWLFG